MAISLTTPSLNRLVPGILIVVCLCVSRDCTVQARTVRDEGQLQNDQLQDPEFPENPDIGEDFWPILCPENNWFSKEQDKCMECSWCPHGQYITHPCYRFQDTQCSPLADLTPVLDSQFQPMADPEGNGNLRNNGGGRGRRHDKDFWSPVAMVLSVIVGVLVLALLVTSVAMCILWRRQLEEEQPKSKPSEKLVCSYRPAPSETV